MVTKNTIKEYQKAKYAGGKGQYRKGLTIIIVKKNNVSESC